MKLATLVSTIYVLVLVSSPALSEEQTIKLSVPAMSCASCPYIVEGAVSQLDGVSSVEATMDDRSATVVFDDAVTSTDAILKATYNVGYESSIVKPENDG